MFAAIEAKWNEKQAQAAADDAKRSGRRQELESEIKAVIDRMKIVTSETVIKHMEEEVVKIEKQIKELESVSSNLEKTVDMPIVLQYARYLVEHLGDILLHLRNPL